MRAYIHAFIFICLSAMQTLSCSDSPKTTFTGSTRSQPLSGDATTDTPQSAELPKDEVDEEHTTEPQSNPQTPEILSTQKTPQTGNNRAPEIVSKPIETYKFGDPIGTAEQFDLTGWSVIRYDYPQHVTTLSEPNWVVKGTKVTQRVNADASIFLSPIPFTSKKITGTWSTSDIDDDFMGFVFGYQDSRHFYLFDWRAGAQTHLGHVADVGMSVKKISADSDLTLADFWPTTGNGDRVISLFHNDTPWVGGESYQFELDFAGGAIGITVKNGDEIIAKIVLTDTTYPSGKFGFYNFSQGEMSYEGFSYTPIQGTDYKYQVIATDPDQDSLTYELLLGPQGMKIDSKSGLITWSKDHFTPGSHKISVRVQDSHGLDNIQNFSITD